MISERTAFLVIVTMALLVALAVAPAAAREILDSGNTVYVGEEDIAFAGAFGVGPVTQIVHYSDPTAGTIDKTIQADAVGNITELTKTTIGTTTGPYYVFDAAGDPTDRATALGYINVQNPQATLAVVLSANTQESIDGKSVARATPVAFKLLNNLNGLAGTGAAMNIEVILPGGGVTTQFGGQTLSGIAVNGTTALVNPVNLSTAAAGTYTAIAKWPGTSDFYGKGFDSNAVTFEVLTKSLAITSNKDSVVRGNSFTVTITGESVQDYRLFIRPDTTLANEEYPFAVAGQNGVTPGAADPSRNMTVRTNAAGTRSVQFNTNQSTGDWIFTIRVEDPASPGIYDEVRVRVERGAVTITASGTGVYYLGEEITLSGTNTASGTTYLFLTGPNCPTNGVGFEDVNTGAISAGVQTGNESTFTRVAVEADDTWTYRWDTSRVNRVLDAGGYTIYAVSEPRSKDSLSDAQYSTASIQVRAPSVTATASGATVAKGDDLTITGVATGSPANICVWIFGKNYSRFQQPVPVELNSTFEYTIESGDLGVLTSVPYSVVVQHPMDDRFDVWVSGTTLTGNGITAVDLATLQAPDAAIALIDALDSPDVDDIYANLTFLIEAPWLLIDPIDDKAAGSMFTISGTTNLAAGDILNVEVTSAAFDPHNSAGTAGVATVQQGDDANTWSFEVDGASFKPDQYSVNVESIETDTTSTATFNVTDVPLPGENLTLSPGWNFISIPRPLAAGNDTAAIFEGVKTGGRSAFRYDTAAGDWIALQETDRLAPLEGIWIYSTGPATVPLNFSTDPLTPPAERALAAGWNAVGIAGTAPTTARDTLLSVDGQWTTLIGFDTQTQAFETGIVNGGSGTNTDSRLVYPGRGYWLYMTGPGTLCAIGV